MNSYSFRNKKNSFLSKSLRLVRIENEDGTVKLTDRDLFCMSYKYRLFYRESCYNCRYASRARCSDVTLGDFWGLENEIPSLRKERIKGISMIQFNTEKAKQLRESIEKHCSMNRYQGDFSRYDYMFGSTKEPEKKIPQYLERMDFIEYLKRIITIKDRWEYSHRETVRRMRGIYAYACRLVNMHRH